MSPTATEPKTALITGAARGIGQGCAEALAAEGVHVVRLGADIVWRFHRAGRHGFRARRGGGGRRADRIRGNHVFIVRFGGLAVMEGRMGRADSVFLLFGVHDASRGKSV